MEQWNSILDVVQANELLPVFDAAYIGFATGNVDEDAYAVRESARRGIPMLVAQSCAKNMGLYNERIGALHVCTPSAEHTRAVLSQLEVLARAMYSNPPAHGALLASTILSDKKGLYPAWRAELQTVVTRYVHSSRALRPAAAGLRWGFGSFRPAPPPRNTGPHRKHSWYAVVHAHCPRADWVSTGSTPCVRSCALRLRSSASQAIGPTSLPLVACSRSLACRLLHAVLW